MADAKHLVLDYWFPRADRTLQPQDIRELKLITIQYYSKGKVINRNWVISLATEEAAYTSVRIHEEEEANRALVALEQWAGRPHTPYLRQGRFGAIRRMEPGGS